MQKDKAMAPQSDKNVNEVEALVRRGNFRAAQSMLEKISGGPEQTSRPQDIQRLKQALNVDPALPIAFISVLVIWIGVAMGAL